jgi:pyrroline-5-carboxylate reductase
MKSKIGIIGFGNMGSAIGQRLKLRYQIYAFDKDRNKTQNLSDINVVDNVIALVNIAETVILAVKPQDFDSVLRQIKGYVQDKLIVSIAAGIPTGYIEKRLNEAKVVRVMPNLPSKIGRGMSCLSKGRLASGQDLNFTEQLFKNLGETISLSEDMMDAATAISGSGPGYNYYLNEGKTLEEIKKYTEDSFIPSLTASAQKLGFSPEQAKILAVTTGIGSVVFLEETKLSPAEAKKQVASKGGTTEAGLEVLQKKGSLDEATLAAKKRAEELSKKE